MSELSIVGVGPTVKVLNQLYPYLKAKRPQARLVFIIADKLSNVKTEADFIEVCKLVDKIAEYTDSKGRKNTSNFVQSTLLNIKTPVETCSYKTTDVC